jgi:hypothetical protein
LAVSAGPAGDPADEYARVAVAFDDHVVGAHGVPPWRGPEFESAKDWATLATIGARQFSCRFQFR